MELTLSRLYATERRLEGLLFKDVTCKLAMLLLELEARYGLTDDEDASRLSRPFTHQEMANLIGATRETVSLTLSDFRRRGLIDFEKRQLIIRDVEGLVELVS